MKEKVITAIKWSLYWLCIIGVYIAISVTFGNYWLYLPILALAAIPFLIWCLFRRFLVKLRYVWIKRVVESLICVLSVVLICVSFYHIVDQACPINNRYIDSFDFSTFDSNSEVSYDHQSGVYTVKATEDELRVLQLTDIHIGGSLSTATSDRKAFKACYELIKASQPDLIIVTGDIVYPIAIQTFNRDNLLPMWQFCRFMNHFGIPWMLVYGNHDTEVLAKYDARTINQLYASFLQEEHCPMLYADVQPDIYGRYNQHLRLEDRNGRLDRLLFLIDSNDYVKGSFVQEYDSVHADQMAWYADTIDAVSKEEGRLVHSFVYMHIPFQAFDDAQQAYYGGQDDVDYLFGLNRELVSCPDRDSGFFELIVDKKSTEAVFVGHDHLNNAGFTYRGVDLVYSKSIDYIAYPRIAETNEQRGATLVTLKNGAYTIEQISYSS